MWILSSFSIIYANNNNNKDKSFFHLHEKLL